MAFFIKFGGLVVLALVLLYIGSLVNLYLQLGRYQRYWNAKNQAVAPDDAILYVALGDSAAQGIGATSPAKGYVGLIGNELAKQHNRPVKIVNLSKSGGKVRDVLDTQLPAMKQYAPDKDMRVTIEIGANDTVNFDEQKFTEEVDELMSQLPKQTVVSDIPYFGASRYRSKQANVEKANQILQAAAQQHGFTLVPLHAQTKANGRLSTFAADWFHPSNTGYRENWLPVFMEGLK